MILVVETNITRMKDKEGLEHCSRVIEVNSWEEYIEDIKNVNVKYYNGSILGFSVPHHSHIISYDKDDLSLHCKIETPFMYFEKYATKQKDRFKLTTL